MVRQVTEGDVQNSLVERIAEAVASKLGQPKPAPSLTFAQLAILYSESPDAKNLRTWVGTEAKRVANLVRVLGDRRVMEMSLADVDHYRTIRAQEPGLKGRKIQPATRNREVVRLGAMLKWAATRNHIPESPLPPLKMEPEANERETYRSEEDARAIVAAAKARGRHVIAAMIATTFDAGLRRGEVCFLRRDQMQEDHGIIVIRAMQTKVREGRYVILSSWASRLIRKAQSDIPSPYLFVTRLGEPYHPRTFLRYYQEACEAAGVMPADGESNCVHDLRSGFADNQVALSTPIHDVMKMAGWKDYRTAQRYLRRHGILIAQAARARLEAARKNRRGPKKSERKNVAVAIDSAQR